MLSKRQDKYGYRPVETAKVDHLPKIGGYDFDAKFDFDKFIAAYATTGFQATHFSRAIEIWNEMQSAKATVFLTYTSNMITSGVRESIRHLVKHKKVHVLVTSAGGIEEDLIKCLKPFVVGRFDAPGRVLFSKGINRTGNVFVPNDRFLHFERFFNETMEKLYKKQKVFHTVEMIRELGLAIHDESSVLYWAAKNDIPVFCPVITDGSIGDLIQFFKQRHPDFLLDVSKDIVEITKISLNTEVSGVVCLGGGSPKHFALNANIFKDGADFAIYINTAQEYDGSDSGAAPDEAVTWAKIKPNAPSIKVFGDASILFPLLVAATRKKK